jgi:hypothetical protein
MSDYLISWDEEVRQVLELLSHQTIILVIINQATVPARKPLYINEWLLREGLLVLEDEQPGVMQSIEGPVDWDTTGVHAEPNSPSSTHRESDESGEE